MTLNTNSSPPMGERIKVRGFRQRRYKDGLIGKARNLRRLGTPAEQKLWVALREFQKQTGIRFHRQKPIGPYIADFYCFAWKCVIEIDGRSHEGRLDKDKKRDAYMEKRGLHIFRFTESDTQKNCDAIIKTLVSHTATVTPAPLSPPPEGEGKV